MIFKCKNCGGNVIYSPEKKGMICPFCDSQDSGERKDYEGQDMQICPNCGGEVPVQEHTSAVQCPYCDNYIVLNERVEGEFEPKLIIPFQIGKETCKKMLRENFGKCLFAPIDFLSEVRLNSMQGNYIPFWMYDYDVNMDYQGEGSRLRVWTSGEYQYTETSIYNVHRNMQVSYDRIPVDASVQMADDVMDLMEPYRYEQLEAFRPEYLSGFRAEKYNMAAEIVEFRAKEKMEKSTENLLQQSISGYNSIRQLHKDTKVINSESRYGLLPVWAYLYQYKGETYPFYVNGQTGKIVGNTPISKGKVWAYGITLWASLTAILGLLFGILSFV